MKNKIPLVSLLALLAYASASIADDDKSKQAGKDGHGQHEAEKGHDHDHDHAHDKIVAGPNGGRVLTSVEPHLEFFVAEDRTVRITALDDDLKATKIDKQTVKIVAGDRRKPTRLKFAEKDGVLVSDGKLPDGNAFPIVIQIKAGKLAKSVNEKFNLDLEKCPTCENKEYACTCDHHDHGDGGDDKHEHEAKK